MGSIGAPELIIVLLVVLLLFGSTKLPKLARSIGEASKEFKKGVNDAAQDGGHDVPTAAPQAPAPAAAVSPPPAAPLVPPMAPPPVAPAAQVPAAAGEEKVTLTRAQLDALLAERDTTVTMTRAELDALLAEREAKARNQTPPQS